MDATISEYREILRARRHIFPVYYYDGEVLDGAERLIASALEGIPVERVTINRREDAARVLWRMRPRDAHERFARDLPLLQAAALLGASPSEVAPYRRQPSKRAYKPPVNTRNFRARIPERLAGPWSQLAVQMSITYSEGVAVLIQWALSHPNEFAAALRYHRLVRRPKT